jgi:hypothetical protein
MKDLEISYRRRENHFLEHFGIWMFSYLLS